MAEGHPLEHVHNPLPSSSEEVDTVTDLDMTEVAGSFRGGESWSAALSDGDPLAHSRSVSTLVATGMCDRDRDRVRIGRYNGAVSRWVTIQHSHWWCTHNSKSHSYCRLLCLPPTCCCVLGLSLVFVPAYACTLPRTPQQIQTPAITNVVGCGSKVVYSGGRGSDDFLWWTRTPLSSYSLTQMFVFVLLSFFSLSLSFPLFLSLVAAFPLHL